MILQHLRDHVRPHETENVDPVQLDTRIDDFMEYSEPQEKTADLLIAAAKDGDRELVAEFTVMALAAEEDRDILEALVSLKALAKQGNPQPHDLLAKIIRGEIFPEEEQRLEKLSLSLQAA